MTQNKQYLTPNEVAKMLMVTPMAVRKWAQAEDIKALTTPGGHRRFLLKDVQDFAKRKGINLLNFNAAEAFKILIVDDDKMVCEYLKELFKLHDETVEVHAVHDGFSAGAMIKELMPNTILLDLKMPGLNGFDVCRLIKNDPMTGNIRVITMTGHYSNDSAKKALDAGAERCLSKPIDDEELIKVVGIK